MENLMSITDEERTKIVDFALHYPNVAHSSIDCSHFVCCAIRSVRPDFPYMTTGSIAKEMSQTDHPQAGDIVYFPSPGHVAVLVLENGIWFIGSQTSKGVSPVQIGDNYWIQHPCIYLEFD
jgi:hypothetical protein